MRSVKYHWLRRVRRALFIVAVPVIASSTTDTTGGTNNTTIILTEPAGLSVGELIVLLFADEQSNTNDCPDLSAQGFTRITHPNNSQDCQGAIYWKICDGGESWPITVAGASGDYAVGWALRITGAAGSGVIHRTGAWYGEDSTGNSAVAGEVNTAIDECLGLAFAFYDGADIAPASVSGAGWSLQDSLEDPNNSSGGSAADYATKSLTSAGDTVDCTFSMGGTDGRMAIQIAIAPLTDVTVTVPAGGFTLGGLVPVPDVTDSFEVSLSAWIASSGEPTTTQLTPPGGMDAGDYVAGRLTDDENPADEIALTATTQEGFRWRDDDDDEDEAAWLELQEVNITRAKAENTRLRIIVHDGTNFTEIEFCLKATATAVDSATYEFRISTEGTPLGTYDVYAEWTVGAGVTITVPVGGYTLTGYVPEPKLGPLTVVIPVGGVTMDGEVPLVALGPLDVTVPVGGFTHDGEVPVISLGPLSIVVPSGGVIHDGEVPNIQLGPLTVTVPVGGVTLTGYVPVADISADRTIIVPVGAVTHDGEVPTAALGPLDIAVPVGGFVHDGEVPSVRLGPLTIVVPTGGVVLDGEVPAVQLGPLTITVPAGGFTLDGEIPATRLGPLTIVVPVGGIVVEGYVPIINTGPTSIVVPTGGILLDGEVPIAKLGPLTIAVPNGTIYFEGRVPTVNVSSDVEEDQGLTTVDHPVQIRDIHKGD